MSGLIGDSWIIISASAFNLLWYVVLVNYIKNIWLRTGVCLEREKYVSSDLDNCGYSLILHQILTSNGILKVSVNVESQCGI